MTKTTPETKKEAADAGCLKNTNGDYLGGNFSTRRWSAAAVARTVVRKPFSLLHSCDAETR